MADLQRFHHFGAWEHVTRALALNPMYPPARQLIDDLKLVEADLIYEVELFPEYAAGDRAGHSTLLRVSWLPRSRFSGTLLHEYRHRFRTHNSRVLLRGDWRVQKQLTFFLLGGFGYPAEVVPEWTAAVGAAFPLAGMFDGGARYTWDRTPWGGHLHRLRVHAGAGLPLGFGAELAYGVGILAHCGQIDDAHSMQASGSWDHESVRVRLKYGWGLELDNPIREVGLAGLFTAEGCPKVESLGQGPLSLPELKTHVVGADVDWRFHPRVTLKLGYDVGIRTQTTFHTTRVGVRTWF